ncbi:MAG: tetratricopeptide repeat protein [bacterium]|nr:tetratricopeptide repeat protein [bacterium]
MDSKAPRLAKIGFFSTWLLLIATPGLLGAGCGPDEAWVDERMKTALDHYQNRRLDPAYSAAIEVVDQAPGNAAARILVTRVEYYRKNFEAAAEHCGAVLDDNPEHFGALLWLARIWSTEEGKEREAMALIHRALRIETRSPELWYLKGLLHERMGEVADAITAYRVGTADNRIALSHIRLSELYAKAELNERRDHHRKMATVLGAQKTAAADQ